MAITLIGNLTTTFSLTANGQTAILDEGNTISVTGDGVAGINGGSYDNTTVIVGGSVGADSTYGYNSANGATNQALIVEESGELIARSYGAVVRGTGSVVDNDGRIEATSYAALYLEGRGATAINSETGLIQGERIGVQNNIHSMTLYNAGDIKAGEYGVHSKATNSATGAFIDNSGLIKGGIYGIYFENTGGADQVINRGTIKSGDTIAIYGNDSAQHIVNKGAIKGDVSLLGGDDVFLGRSGGTVDGTVFAGDGADEVRGGKGEDFLNGEAGDDMLKGSSGDDQIWGGGDNDTLIGGSGEDRLKGDAGNDTINGGKGDDKFWGGDGADTFVLKGTTDKDRLNDFDQGVDQIDLSAYGVASFNDLETDAIDYRNGNAYIDMDAIGGDGLLIVKNIADFNDTDFILS